MSCTIGKHIHVGGLVRCEPKRDRNTRCVGPTNRSVCYCVGVSGSPVGDISTVISLVTIN